MGQIMNIQTYSTRQLIHEYGAGDLRPVFEDKIRYYTRELSKSRRFTPAQRYFLQYRMGLHANWAITIGEQLKRQRLKEKLAYWCGLYLKTLPEEPKSPDKLTDQQIQQAREYPTHELFQGRLIRSGRNFKAHCPFHDERTPSFYFYASGSYHCFGCQTHGGSAIDYLMATEKLRFSEAVRRLL